MGEFIELSILSTSRIGVIVFILSIVEYGLEKEREINESQLLFYFSMRICKRKVTG